MGTRPLSNAKSMPLRPQLNDVFVSQFKQVVYLLFPDTAPQSFVITEFVFLILPFLIITNVKNKQTKQNKYSILTPFAL